MAVKIIGANCSLGEAVIDKLLVMDVDVISEDNSHFSRNKRLLEFSNVSLLKKGEGFSMSFDGSNADIVIGKDIIISDLIPSRADKWMPEEIKAWLEHKETDVRERYWLSVVDAANTLAIIAKSGKRYQTFTCVEEESGYLKTLKQNSICCMRGLYRENQVNLPLKHFLDMRFQEWRL